MRVALALADLESWTGGSPLGELPSRFSGLSTDTRSLLPGEIFVPLRGPHFDGHQFLEAARRAGATAAMVERSARLKAELGAALPRLEVDDTLEALGRTAHGHRERFDLPVVAVTGSVGKTSTKDLCAAALSPLGSVHRTEGNRNNHVGVPLTLLGIDSSHRAAVIEMGMNHEGEIGRLAALAAPGVGLVTNVAAVHLEQLGSLDAVARAKGELYRALPPDGVAVANADDPLVVAQARSSGRRTVTFGQGPSDVRLVELLRQDLSGLTCRLDVRGEAIEVSLALIGSHQALNAAAAIAAALACGVPGSESADALSSVRAGAHRMELVSLPGSALLLDDCYNASPRSMEAALETVRRLGVGRRLGAVLGDMLELGPEEAALHREVGTRARGLDYLLAFGPRSTALAEGARAAGVAVVEHTESFEQALAWVQARLGPKDLLLVKGSRGMALERFRDALGGTPGEAH
jgi:UDP-N-acetylmuramoyl-tripeptide--D-alanyl-D-alanine ligase